MTDGVVLARVRSCIDPEAALRLRAMHGQIEARQHRLVEPLAQTAAAERRGVDQRHGARPMRHQRRGAGHVQRLVEIHRDHGRRPFAQDHPAQAQHGGQRELAAALELVQRHVAAQLDSSVYGAVEAGQVTATPSSLRRFAMRAILRSDPPTARLLSTNSTSLRGGNAPPRVLTRTHECAARSASIGTSRHVGVVMADRLPALTR